MDICLHFNGNIFEKDFSCTLRLSQYDLLCLFTLLSALSCKCKPRHEKMGLREFATR